VALASDPRARVGVGAASRALIASCFVAALLTTSLGSSPVSAQNTIRTPGARPQYALEIEPHLVIGWLPPPGAGAPPGVGLGVRGTFEVAKDGFLPKLNDSVGVGVGLDWAQYDGRADQECGDFDPGPNGTDVCVELGGNLGEVTTFHVPVVMQWNFWLTRRWSVFGEPGILIHFDDQVGGIWPLILSGGGRFHIQDKFTLTARIGYPAFTFGVSFLL
jgi:hypothetical protein